MTTNSKDLTINAWKTFATRDPERIAALFAPGAEWIAPKGNATARALNVTDHMIGGEQVAHFISVEYDKLFKDAQWTFRAIHADQTTAIVESNLKATLSNGRSYNNDYCFVVEFDNGLIKQVREFMDTRRGWEMVFGDTEP